jgi:ABC-2 type transport system ATP-binding protein
LIEVRNLAKHYGSFVAVDDLSFSVAPGEIVGLVGPNGAGKTTTLRCLVGILRPTAGAVLVGGFDLAKDPVEAKRRLAWMPDEPHLFDYPRFARHRYGPPVRRRRRRGAGARPRGTRLADKAARCPASCAA